MKTFSFAVGAALLCAITPAFAQEQLFRTVEATPGRQIQLALIGNATKECTPGPEPEVKVVTPPKNGVLAVRKGKTKPGSLGRCPNLEVPAIGIFYIASLKLSGTDEVVYGVTRSDGRNQLVTIRINVSNRSMPLPRRPQGGTDL